MHSDFMKNGAKLFHYWISKSQFATHLYILFVSHFCKYLPSLKLKQQILNSINSIEWKDFDLPPQVIYLGSKEKVRIIPHFHEFDLEAIVSSSPNYEREVFQAVESHVEASDVVVEIGGNVGIYSLFFASLFRRTGKIGKIFVFEPSQEAYLRLLKNIKLNGFDNIQAFNVAVSDTIDVKNFFEPDAHLTNGSLHLGFAKHFSSSIRTTKMLTVDGGVLEKLTDDNHHLFIKIDVEGAEFQVLQGLKNLILQKRPKLLIEVLSEYQDQLNQLDFLKDSSYSFWNITDQGIVQKNEFVATQFRDYLLLPS